MIFSPEPAGADFPAGLAHKVGPKQGAIAHTHLSQFILNFLLLLPSREFTAPINGNPHYLGRDSPDLIRYDYLDQINGTISDKFRLIKGIQVRLLGNKNSP